MAERKYARTETSEQLSLAVSQDGASDIARVVDAAMKAAGAFCAQKLRLDAGPHFHERLREGHQLAWMYWQHGLTKELAEQIGALDPGVRGVYTYEADATPEDVAFSGRQLSWPLHLVVHVDRKTAAMASIVSSIERSVRERLDSINGAPRATQVLDIQLVDDAEVGQRTGLGALLSSTTRPPLALWRR